MRIEPVRVKPFAQNSRRQREMVVQRIRASQRRHRRKPFDEEYAAKGAGQEFVEPRQQPYLLDRLRECPRSARNSKKSQHTCEGNASADSRARVASKLARGHTQFQKNRAARKRVQKRFTAGRFYFQLTQDQRARTGQEQCEHSASEQRAQ